VLGENNVVFMVDTAEVFLINGLFK
jgi:hypothetical protein